MHITQPLQQTECSSYSARLSIPGPRLHTNHSHHFGAIAQRYTANGSSVFSTKHTTRFAYRQGLAPDKFGTFEFCVVDYFSNGSHRIHFSSVMWWLWNPSKKKMTINKRCRCLMSLESRQAGRQAHTHTHWHACTQVCTYTQREKYLTEHLSFSLRLGCGRKTLKTQQ